MDDGCDYELAASASSVSKGTSLWRWAAGAVKDGHSLWVASRRQYPELEQAVIRATSHDASHMDYTNTQWVFTWVRTSPGTFLPPLMQTLGRRMQRTHSWVVAVKGLMLLHGVFCAKLPLLHTIGRLPFNLSNFQDRFCCHGRSWGYTAFVRSYFAFLEEKSRLLADSGTDDDDAGTSATGRALSRLEKSQRLLDLLLQIMPHADGMWVHLIIEAMDCVVIEIFDIYSNMCREIARVLVEIFSASHREAITTLQIIKRVASQGNRLTDYFNICREMGVFNATELPDVQQIPTDDIEDLEQLIYGASMQNGIVSIMNDTISDENYQKEEVGREISINDSDTLISKDWVPFHDDLLIENRRGTSSEFAVKDPFSASLTIPPHVY